MFYSYFKALLVVFILAGMMFTTIHFVYLYLKHNRYMPKDAFFLGYSTVSIMFLNITRLISAVLFVLLPVLILVSYVSPERLNNIQEAKELDLASALLSILGLVLLFKVSGLLGKKIEKKVEAKASQLGYSTTKQQNKENI